MDGKSGELVAVGVESSGLSILGGPVPALLRSLGEPGLLRFLEFFTVNIRNRNTREAYGRAARNFLRWCEERGLAELKDVQPVHVAAYVEEIGRGLSRPTVKQHLACIRMLFDWLIVGQVVRSNPAAAVRGPKHSVAVGSTPVLAAPEARTLLDSIAVVKTVVDDGVEKQVPDLVGLRDRALIALMTYTFARVEASVSMKVEDFYPERRRWSISSEKKAARSTKCRRITTWSSISTSTSRPPASRKIPRGRCSALPTGTMAR